MKITQPDRAMVVAILPLFLCLTGCDQSPEKGAAQAPTANVTPASPAAPAPTAPAPTPVAPLAVSAREGWPTEEEAKATILKIEYDINASETNKSVWHVKDFKHEVKSVKFADATTQKQMKYGAAAQTVYPVKILYTQVTDYTTKPTTRVEAGADGVWFFYKNSFGEWTAKYGSE